MIKVKYWPRTVQEELLHALVTPHGILWRLDISCRSVVSPKCSMFTEDSYVEPLRVPNFNSDLKKTEMKPAIPAANKTVPHTSLTNNLH